MRAEFLTVWLFLTFCPEYCNCDKSCHKELELMLNVLYHLCIKHEIQSLLGDINLQQNVKWTFRRESNKHSITGVLEIAVWVFWRVVLYLSICVFALIWTAVCVWQFKLSRLSAGWMRTCSTWNQIASSDQAAFQIQSACSNTSEHYLKYTACAVNSHICLRMTPNLNCIFQSFK